MEKELEHVKSEADCGEKPWMWSVYEHKYRQLIKRLCELMLPPPYDEDEAEEVAMEAWQADSRGLGYMSQTMLYDAMFELCDMWTLTTEPAEYVTFLARLSTSLADFESNDDDEAEAAGGSGGGTSKSRVGDDDDRAAAVAVVEAAEEPGGRTSKSRVRGGVSWKAQGSLGAFEVDTPPPAPEERASRHEAHRRRRAAVVIQRRQKAKSVNRNYREKRSAAVQVQKNQRRHFVRQQTAKVRAAAVLVQDLKECLH